MTIRYNEEKALLKIITEDGRIKMYHPIPIVKYWQFMTLRKEKLFGKAWKVIERYKQPEEFMPW